jgi:hypothetical protein
MKDLPLQEGHDKIAISPCPKGTAVMIFLLSHLFGTFIAVLHLWLHIFYNLSFFSNSLTP